MERKQPASFAHLAIALEGGVGGMRMEKEEGGEGKQNIRSVVAECGRGMGKINKFK